MELPENKKKVVARIQHLTQQINFYNQQFFQYHRSLISDYEFDQLISQLTELEQKYPKLRQADSPIGKVGERTSKGFPTLQHKKPMLSLSNTYSEEELKQFHARIQKWLPTERIAYFCELKFDGVAVSLHYKEGRLQHVVTRGDGLQGDDITANALRTISGLPRKLSAANFPSSFEVRGEVIMTKKNFAALNQSQKEKGEPLFANPRNTTSGTLKTLDLASVSHRKLSFLPYTLMIEESPPSSQEEALATLTEWGFPNALDLSTEIASANRGWLYKRCDRLEEVVAYIHHWAQHRTTLPFEIDGIVIKVNSVALQKELGTTQKSPRWTIAYKYKPMSGSAQLQEISYQVGRTGIITPVALLTPTRLAGSTIQRASLYNSQEIASLDLHQQDTVFIEKGGDVIPKVTGVDKSQRVPNAVPFLFIDHCPSCHTPLVKVEEEAHHFCPNRKGCPDQLKAAIAHFVHRQAMNISHIGYKTIQLLFQKKIIQRPADLYDLTRDQLVDLEGFQEKSIQNLLTSINQSKEQPFKKVLFALGIRYVGKTVAEKLVDSLRTIEALQSASLEEITQVPEIGPQTAQSLLAYFSDPYEQLHLERLKKAGLQFQSRNQSSGDNQLEGIHFVVTGTFENFSRDQIKAYIKNHGGRLTTSLSAKVDYLVTGAAPGPKKVSKATQLKIPVLSEKALQALVENQKS